MFLEIQDFNFCPKLIKFYQIYPYFTQFNLIYPHYTQTCLNNMLEDAAASPAPTPLSLNFAF